MLPMAVTISDMNTAWTSDARIVSVQVIAIPPEPGAAGSVLPMPFHHTGKKVFGLYQSDPLTMLKTTHTTTANQLIEPKSIAASYGKGDWHTPIHAHG